MQITQDMLDAALQEAINLGILVNADGWSPEKREQIGDILQAALDAHPVLCQVEKITSRDVSISIRTSPSL